ncbi:MAG: Octanoyltransferase LipM [Syntrophus sp. PtaB.Bin075]|nr:MAG: Octanoyltransferase LipM [Syntrophus sp. PtaB.Bin075]
MKTWRRLDTGAMPAALNMAIDEAMLRLHVPGESRPTLRFYSWTPPAVSLGYFQKHHAIDLAACQKLGIDVVRRVTGGRAVLHQNDLTYSVVSDSRQGIPSSLEASYRLICNGLLEGFRLMGFTAEHGKEQVGITGEDICFMRAAVADIVYEGRKFVGSAQKWQGSSLLQHGSIVLEPQVQTWVAIIKTDSLESLHDSLESRITCLREILGRKIDPGELKQAIARGMAEALQTEFEGGELSSREWELAEEIAAGKTLSGIE